MQDLTISRFRTLTRSRVTSYTSLTYVLAGWNVQNTRLTSPNHSNPINVPQSHSARSFASCDPCVESNCLLSRQSSCWCSKKNNAGGTVATSELPSHLGAPMDKHSRQYDTLLGTVVVSAMHYCLI